MEDQGYLRWLARETPTVWWHDSADPDEVDVGLDHAAVGVTTNPVLTQRALVAHVARWRETLGADAAQLSPVEKAQAITRVVACDAARKFEAEHISSGGAMGYVCAQIDPTRAGDRETMLAMARRYHTWAPNIAVKMPVTAAGLDVLEECIADGITVTATISFTVPQVVAVAERHRAGAARARQAGIVPGHCFAVIMIGRLDDYIRDVAWDGKAEVSETDLQQAGLAVSKRAYQIYQEGGYEAVLLVAALRGTYHMTELAGAELVMSIHPRHQAMLLEPGVPKETRIDRPIAPDVIDRLCQVPEFVRSFEPEGMPPSEFIAFGATQRTLSQFIQVGWAMLEAFDGF